MASGLDEVVDALVCGDLAHEHDRRASFRLVTARRRELPRVDASVQDWGRDRVDAVVACAPVARPGARCEDRVGEAHGRALHHGPDSVQLGVDLGPADRVCQHHQRAVQVHDGRDGTPLRAIQQVDIALAAPLRHVNEVNRLLGTELGECSRHRGAPREPSSRLGADRHPSVESRQPQDADAVVRGVVARSVRAVRQHRDVVAERAQPVRLRLGLRADAAKGRGGRVLLGDENDTHDASGTL